MPTNELQPISSGALDLSDISPEDAADAELCSWAALAWASPITRKGKLNAEQLEAMIEIANRRTVYATLRRVMAHNGVHHPDTEELVFLDPDTLPSWQEQEHRRGT